MQEAGAAQWQSLPSDRAQTKEGPREEPPPNTNVYVTGLPSDTDDNKLKVVFQPYGEVTWCRVISVREGRDSAAIVEFKTVEQAAWVVQNMKGAVPQGLVSPIEVHFKDESKRRRRAEGTDNMQSAFNQFMGGGNSDWNAWSDDAAWPQGFWNNVAGGATASQSVEVPPSDNVFIKNITADITEEKMKTVFSTFGNITQCKFLPTGNKFSALIRLATVSEATALLEGLKADPVPPGFTEPLEARYGETPESRQKRFGDGTLFGIDTIVKGFQMSGLMPGGTGYNAAGDSALYVAGLPPDATDFHLYRLFSPLGAIAPKGVRAMTGEDGTCKGIGFVNYLERQSAELAISIYNGTVMPEGGRLKVAIKMNRKGGDMPHVVPAPMHGSTYVPVPEPKIVLAPGQGSAVAMGEINTAAVVIPPKVVVPSADASNSMAASAPETVAQQAPVVTATPATTTAATPPSEPSGSALGDVAPTDY